jgi:hypothetical protein
MSTRTVTGRRNSRRPADVPADPGSPAVGLPTFSAPIGRGETPADEGPIPAPEEVRTTGPTVPLDGVSWKPYGGEGSRDTIPTRTEDSSERLTGPTRPSKTETARNAGILLAGILTVAAGLAAVVLARAGRQLRRPTREETRAVAQPVARILVRHIPADMITADLADMGEAAAGISDWMSAGPVAPRVVAVQHIGMVPPPDADPDTAAAADVPTRTPGEAFHAAMDLDLNPSALGDPGPAPEVTYLQ